MMEEDGWRDPQRRRQPAGPIYRLCEIPRRAGTRLGFSPCDEKPVLWLESSGETALAFYPQSSAAFSQPLRRQQHFAERRLSSCQEHASLAVYKAARRDPPQPAGSQRLALLKFRHLRFLLDNSTLTLENLDERCLDPLTESLEQMRLL
jgi:hypothetical protein